MMEQSLYARQEQLALTVPKQVALVGCGGIGFWVGLQLAMAGVPHLDLIDPDMVEKSNLNRLPLSESSLGFPKVHALRDLVHELRPDTTVVAYPIPVTEFLLKTMQITALMDCTDDYNVQLMCYKYCCSNSIRYIRAGYNGGTHITVTSTVAEWDANPDVASTRYAVVPSWVAPAVAAAALVLVKLMLLPELEFCGGVDLRRDYERS